jgi:hypothetical protein
MSPEEELADRGVAQFEPNIDIRDLVVAWFHDAEEICEHDEPPPACETMAGHLLAAFDVVLRDWKAYAAPNRRQDAARAQTGLDVERLREAARRASLPREVSVADIENLAAEYDRLGADR